MWMKIPASIFIVWLVSTAALAQQNHPSKPVDMSKEPHHRMLFENSVVRVFRVELQSGEVTIPHRHEHWYAYLSLHSSTIANEVHGRTPVIVTLENGEVHTSKGGFTLAERNKSAEPADLIVVETLKSDGSGFAAPIGGFRFHDAAFGELFEFPAMRGYEMTIASGGRTDKHTEACDRMIVAVSDIDLWEDADGQSDFELTMKAGDTKWFPRGLNHATTNTGKSPARFLTFEFP